MDQIWTRIQADLKTELGPQNFEIWIRPIQLVAHGAGQIYFQVPNRYYRDWVKSRYSETIQHAFQHATGEPVAVESLSELRRVVPAAPLLVGSGANPDNAASLLADLGTESRIEEVEAPIHASNVLLWSEKIEKAVRTRMRWVGDGGSLHDSERSALASFSDAPKRLKKVRWSPKSEEIFD